MIASYLLVLISSTINLSNQCALPYWWTQRFHLQPYEYVGGYQQSPVMPFGQPRTTYKYRSIFHRPDPNSYVHLEEYSEYTWFEHSTNTNKDPVLPPPNNLNGMTNVVFSKDGFFNYFNNLRPVKTHGSFPGLVFGFRPPADGTNGMIPQGSDVPDDTNTNGMVPGYAVGDEDVNPPNSDGVLRRSNGMTPETNNGGENSGESVPTTTTTLPAEDDIPNTLPAENNVPTTTQSSERERNEDEVEIVSESENIEGNELDTSSSEPSSRIKAPDGGDTFFGGWFGSKVPNETYPCKVSESDIYSLRTLIENMFSSPRDHMMHMESKEKAREDILKKFRNFGLQVWTQNFTTPPMIGLNGTEESNEGVNLIGVIPGSQRGKLDDEIVLVGAHYDTVADSNGVDDNGSGLAVMLEVARAITEARCRLNHTLMFVAFDHQEHGAMGSNYFVDHYLIPEELKRARGSFQGAFILDGILNYNNIPETQELPLDYAESLPGFQYFVNNTGNRGNFLAMISRNEMDNHLSQKLLDAWQELDDRQMKLFNLAVDMGNEVPAQDIIEKHVNFLRSDHATFWYHNSSSHFPQSLNAVLLTDTGPFRGQMKECYHSKCDDLTVMSPEKLYFAKKTADALTATLVNLTRATGAGSRTHVSVIFCLLQVLVLHFLKKIAMNS